MPGAEPIKVKMIRFKAYGPFSLPNTIWIIVFAISPYITRYIPVEDATKLHNPIWIKKGFNINPVPMPSAPFKNPAMKALNSHLKITQLVYLREPSINLYPTCTFRLYSLLT